MIIPKERLEAETTREMVEQVLNEHLSMPIDGDKCDRPKVLNVLVKAAIEGQTIESVCEDATLAMESNAIREQLNRTLDVCDLTSHAVEVNAALRACLPVELPRRGLEMALDWHDEPFYGKTPELRLYAWRGAAKEGTTYFYRLASLDVIWRQVRVTLALTSGLPEDSNLSIVQRLRERMRHLGFRRGVLYMDKEFCEGPILRYLTGQQLPALIACPMRGERGRTRALCRGRKAYCTSYTFSDGTTARLALMPSRVPDASGHRRVKWLAFAVSHLDWSAKKIYQRYRRRFGIESAYRQFARLRARTASRNPALRFLLLGLALLLLNIWIILRWLATRVIGRGPARWHEDAFRLHRFIVFLRRAIERLIGVTDSIPIHSC